MNPYVWAFLTTICFGLTVIPWVSTVKNLGMPAIFLFIGGAYIVAGLIGYGMSGFQHPLTVRSAAVAVSLGLVYVGAMAFCSLAYADPSANSSIVVAITSAYPVVAALVGFIFLHQRLTSWQMVLFTVAVLALTGLAFAPQAQPTND